MRDSAKITAAQIPVRLPNSRAATSPASQMHAAPSRLWTNYDTARANAEHFENDRQEHGIVERLIVEALAVIVGTCEHGPRVLQVRRHVGRRRRRLDQWIDLHELPADVQAQQQTGQGNAAEDIKKSSLIQPHRCPSWLW